MSLSIIVTSYWPKAKPYLDHCLESIRLATKKHQIEAEVIVVAPKSYAPQYLGVRTISPPEAEYHNPRAINFGIENSGGSKLLVLNDDTILTGDSIINMLAALHWSAGRAIVMPISNDQQNAYFLEVDHVRRGPLPRDGSVDPTLLRSAESIYAPGLILPETLCLYAFMMSRSFYDEVGPFDENLKTGFDDTDYCVRAKQKGGILAIATASLVYHYGGVSADNTLTSKIRAENEAYFRKKWGFV